MPSPAKTTDAGIVAAARKLIEQRGGAGVSLADIAAAVGVRAPSLYGRFADRAAILAAVEVELWRALGEAVARAPRSRDPKRTLAAVARAYRAFAKANPKGYALIYAAEAERSDEGRRARAAAVASVLLPLAALVGEKQALAAARVLTPFLHGFVSMELASAFRLGGDVDAAFDYGVAAILAGLEAAPKPRRARNKGGRGAVNR